MGMINKTFGQLFTYSRAGTASGHDADGVLREFGANVVRRVREPSTGRMGWLIEGSETNNRTWSEDFTNAVYTKIQTIVVPAATVAPDGSTTGIKLVEANSISAHYLTLTGPTNHAPSTVYTTSVYAKAGERRYMGLSISATLNSTGAGLSASFDLLSGAVTIQSGTPVVSMHAVGNGWYRCAITWTSAATVTGGNVLCGCSDSSSIALNNYMGDGTSGIFVWGAQNELGAQLTSYTPTAGSSAIHSPDLLTMPTDGWFNPLAGTFVVELHCPQGFTPYGQMISLNDGRTTDDQSSLSLRFNSGGQNIVAVAKIPGQVNTTGTNKTNPTLPFRVALTYDSSGVSVTYDGQHFGISTPALTSTFTKMAIGSEVWNPTSSGVPLNGFIRGITYYPWRMTTVERVAATTI